MFWNRKKQEIKVPHKPPASFIDWAVSKDFFDFGLQPEQRTYQLLKEIQKRTLADQVLIFSWNKSSKANPVTQVCPIQENASIDEELSWLLMEACSDNQIINEADLFENNEIRVRIQQAQIDTILLVPINVSQDQIDALCIINYGLDREQHPILSFMQFVTSVLSLSIQNTQLYHQLRKKNFEIQQWTSTVEERIHDGTKQLLEKELQYYTLFEGTHDGIIVHKPDGEIIEANQVACRLLEIEKKELVQLNIRNIFQTSDTEDLDLFFEKIQNKQKLPPIEIIVQKPGGSSFMADLSSRRVRFRDEDTIQSFIRDVSQRKAVEKRLRESKKWYQILVESSLVGAFIIRDGVILFANDRLADLTGRSKEQLLDKNFYDLIDVEDRSMVRNRESQREQGEDVPNQYEIRLQKQGAELWWGELRCLIIQLEDQPAVLGNVVDITQRKTLEIQLLESQKMESIGTLAGGIAHDFNNLLGGIMGYASLLMSEIDQEHPFYEDIRAIAEIAKQAADLTNRLLAFARKGKYQVTTVNLNQIVESSLDVLKPSINASVTVDKMLVKNLWPIKGDMQQINQVIRNIYSNGIEAMPGGGVLNISTANVILDDSFAQTQLGLNPGNYVRLIISDSGIGMDAKTKAHIFEPFFTTKPAVDAKGLGLSMVYGIIKNHDGTIHVDSELGKGTKVTIYLPKAGVVFEKEETQSSVDLKKGILLVDDKEIIRNVGKRMLEKNGFEVLLAENGKLAIDLYKEKKDSIDLVILDIIMPELGGKEACKQLRLINPNLPIIFTSGYGVNDHPDIILMDDTEFIQKPFQTETLLQLIRKYT